MSLIKWEFPQGTLDGINFKDPVEEAVSSHSDVSSLQIFVRETLQNPGDNPSDSLVRVDYRMSSLQGKPKEEFLNNIGFQELIPHIDSVREYQLKTKNSKKLFPDPKLVLGNKYPINIVTIEDYGTRGLIGPELDREKDFFLGIPHCFLGLCRNVGDSQKGSAVAGGTHGIGKEVLWKNSHLKIILFYSRMTIPYKKANSDTEYRNRFFGQVRLSGHYMGDIPYLGQGYFGKPDCFGDQQKVFTSSLYNEEATELAIKIGMQPRDKDSAGTSIMVVDFDDPDTPDEEETGEHTALRIVDAAERYFWPAIVDNKLQVRVILQKNGDSNTMAAKPEERNELIPFIKAYKAALLKQPEKDVMVNRADITVPKGPDTEKLGKAQIIISTRLAEGEAEPKGGLINKAALIRGAGMVVGYTPAKRGLAGKNFHAIVLGGKACAVPDVNQDQQEHLEKLLAWAEPVTHDNWTESASMLKNWYGSRAAIGHLRDAYQKAISQATLVQTIPTGGNAAPVLAGMFPFGPGPKKESSPRDIRIETLKSPYKIGTVNEEDNHYGFEIKITVPAKENFHKTVKPSKWRVTSKYGFYGEGRRLKVIEHANLRFTEVLADGEGWQEITSDFQPEATFSEQVYEDERIYTLRGETEPLNPGIAESTKHELETNVDRSEE